MSRRTMLAFCAVAVLATGATFISPTKANAEFSISVGDYDDGFSYDYGGRNYGPYRSRHYHNDDHDHDCRWTYRRVPSYHWHDGHYGRHGYIGQISHLQSVYPGQHPAIIDCETWDAVQTTLKQNSHARLVKAHSKNPSLLAGLIVDKNGEKLVTTHANKQGKRYRYYVSPSALRRGRNRQGGEGPKLDTTATPTSWRLPAGEIEGLVTRMLVDRLRNHVWLLDQHANDDVSLENRQSVLTRAAGLAAQLEGDDNIAKRGLALSLIEGVAVERGSVVLTLHAEAMSGSKALGDGPGRDRIVIRQATSLRRRGRETKLVFEGAEMESAPDPALIKAVAQAHRWWRDLLDQRFRSLRDLASTYGTHERYAARILNLAFFSADDTRAILEGTQAAELTLHRFLRVGVAPVFRRGEHSES